MPKAIKKKVKTRTTEDETEVQDRLSEIKDSFRKNQQRVLMFSLPVAAGIAVIAGAFIYRSITGEEVRRIEYEAYKAYHGDSQKKQVTPDQYQKALDLFKKAYAKKKSPRTLLYIAGAQFELAKYDEAISSLNDFIKTYGKEADLISLAYQKLAAVQLRKGNKEEALKTLDTINKLPGVIYKDYALMESGRILDGMGKKDEAKAKFKELTEKFKDSPFAEEAKARLEQKKEG